MKCPKCEAEVVSDALFCQHCGASLQPDKAATPAEKLKGAAPTSHDQDYDPEEELWQGGYSAKAMYGIWLAAGLASFGLLAAAIFLALTGAGMPLALGAGGVVLLLWIAIFGIFLYRKWSVHYELTTQRFIHREGILKRTTDRIEVIDMDDVTYSQGIVQRMLGVGTIQITSTDRSHPELTLIGIDDVQRIAGLIDDVRRTERRRRGLHIEAI